MSSSNRVSHPRRGSRRDIEVSVVIPCLNEEATIGICIRKAQATLQRLGIAGEVIVADNGSTDRSVEIAQSLGARVVHEFRKGYGWALMRGFRAARGEFIIMGDGDDSYDFTDLERFIKPLREGADLVMGTRLKGIILPGAMPWKNRYIGNPFLSGLLNMLFRTGVSDCHCGMRAFRRDALRKMQLRCSGMEFASEMVIKAAKAGLRIVEVPITLYPDGRTRPPHLRPWRDGWRHLKLMLSFSPTWLFSIPGILLLLMGWLILLWSGAASSSPGPLSGGAHWAAAGSLCAILGYQVVHLGLVARAYSVLHRFREVDRLLDVIFRFIGLERGLLIGAIFVLLGLGVNAHAVLTWPTDGGSLQHFRTSLCGSALMVMGIQTIFNAFLLSLLGEQYERKRVPSKNQRSHSSLALIHSQRVAQQSS